MENIDRSKVSEPECLVKNSDKWTDNWKNSDKKSFNWHQYQNEKVSDILVKNLSLLTNYHCSYCDLFPVEKGADKPSIDHFKPKSTYEDLAYEWTNLFLACYSCQSYKLEKYPDIEPLKPDESYYTFDEYFEIDFHSGKINPNSCKSKDEQEKARVTIDLFGLNNDSRPISRKRELGKYLDSNNPILEDWSYRFFIIRGI